MIVRLKRGTWNLPFVNFLAGINTIRINNETEFEAFKELCSSVGFDFDGGREEWQWWHKCKLKDAPLYFEHQPGKGITCYENERDSVEWYGIKPYSLYGDVYEETK